MSRWDGLLTQSAQVSPLPGAEIERFPYLSGYALAWRITRLAALAPSDLKNEFGLRGGAQTDLFAVTRRPDRRQAAFLDQLGLSGTNVSLFWTEEAWSPLQLHGAFDQPRNLHLRHCPACARFGYHTMAFQLPSITKCPWHGEHLGECCPRCGAPHIGTFGSSGALGVCGCGHDLFNVECAATRMWQFPTNAASSWLESYLAWVETERPVRHLVSNPAATPREWASSFAALAAPPQNLLEQVPAPKSEIRTCSSGAISEPPDGHFWGWCMLCDDNRKFPRLAVPATYISSLERATERVLASLPQSTAAPRDLVRKPGSEPPKFLTQSVTNRASCFIPPFGDREQGLAWLNISAIDPWALAICERLVQSAAEVFGELAPTPHRSWQAAKSEALDRIFGRRHLDEALRLMLMRGYEQGIEAVLLSHLGKSWPRSRPWMQPLVEVRGKGHTIESIHIAWAESLRPPVPTHPHTEQHGPQSQRPQQPKSVKRFISSRTMSKVAPKTCPRTHKARDMR